MNETEEKRLCKKCGKRLPSSNNYCMFCGCNNDLYDKQLEDSKSVSSDEEKALNQIIKRESNSLMSKLIYVFILLDIIFISVLLFQNGNNMFYERFAYHLDRYDKVIHLNNDSFLVFKNKKIKILGDSKIDSKIIHNINQSDVLDIGESYPGSGQILVEVNNKIYLFSSNYNSVKEYKIKNSSGNVYEDINKEVYHVINDDNDYYNVIGKNYFIKDDTLYMNERSTDYYHYKSKQVLDRKRLGVSHASIIGCTNSQRSILVKGDTVIKLFTDGKLVQTIKKVFYQGKEYSISDFRYVFLSNGNLQFICKNGFIINSSFDFFDFASYVEASGDTNILLSNLGTDIKDEMLTVQQKNYSVSLLKDFSPFSKLINKAVAFCIIALILLLVLLYYFKDTGFLSSCFILTGYFSVLSFIFLCYVALEMGVSNIDLWNNFKASFSLLPIEFFCSFIIIEIREIAKYLLYKFNIETVYHFPLMIICCSCFIFAVSYLTKDANLLIVLPGIMWVFFSSNDEEDIEYDFSTQDYQKIVFMICGVFALCLLLCGLFHISMYFLYILIVSFCISCSMVIQNNDSFKDYFRKMIVSNICIFYICIVGIFSSILDLFKADSNSFSYISKDALKYNIGTDFLKILFIVAILFFVSVILYFVQVFLKKIHQVENRIFRIIIMMFFVVIIISIIIVFMPILNHFYQYLCGLIFDSKSMS